MVILGFLPTAALRLTNCKPPKEGIGMLQQMGKQQDMEGRLDGYNLIFGCQTRTGGWLFSTLLPILGIIGLHRWLW